MGGLLHARVISSIREIWWDCRPHPDFGTVELRMCDGITNLDDAMALAALAQCVVADLVDQTRRGRTAARRTRMGGAGEQVAGLAPRHGDLAHRGRSRQSGRCGATAGRTSSTECVRRPIDWVAGRSWTGCWTWSSVGRAIAASGRWSTVEPRWWSWSIALVDEHLRGMCVRATWVDDFLVAHRDELVAVRHHLHAHPEPSHLGAGDDGADLRTAEDRRAVTPDLESGTGLWCDIGDRAGSAVPALALRADIDALRMDDTKDVRVPLDGAGRDPRVRPRPAHDGGVGARSALAGQSAPDARRRSPHLRAGRGVGARWSGVGHRRGGPRRRGSDHRLPRRSRARRRAGRSSPWTADRCCGHRRDRAERPGRSHCPTGAQRWTW